MDCEDVKELFSGFLESRLTLFQSALLLEHCDACSGCRRELIGLQNQKSSTKPFRQIVQWPAGLTAPLGAAGVMLLAILGFYMLQRAPADTPAALPVPSSPPNIESHPAAKPPARTAESSTSVEAKAPRDTYTKAPGSPKSSGPPAQHVTPKLAPLPQKNYAAVQRQDRANRTGVTEGQGTLAEDAVSENVDALESSSTAQAEEAAREEKSADPGELRFYSETPPYFFLYKPSMKPL
jgi:hypothetical protein